MCRTLYATCFWFVNRRNKPDWLLQIELDERERMDDVCGTEDFRDDSTPL